MIWLKLEQVREWKGVGPPPFMNIIIRFIKVFSITIADKNFSFLPLRIANSAS